MSFRSRTRVTGAFYIPGFPKGVKWLLISNVAMFLVGFFLQLLRLDAPLRHLPLVPVDIVKYFKIWQLVTYAVNISDKGRQLIEAWKQGDRTRLRQVMGGPVPGGKASSS